jgi:hypothetical protein
MLAEELLSLIEEIEVDDAAYTDEEFFSFGDTDEEVEYDTEDGEEVQESAFIVKDGKKIVLNTLQKQRLDKKKQAKKDGKLKAGMKMVFQKDSSAYKLMTQTSKEKQLAKKFGIVTHRGAANMKRKKSMKLRGIG